MHMQVRLTNSWLYNSESILDFLHGTKVRTRTFEGDKAEKRARDMQCEKEQPVGSDVEDGEKGTCTKESGKLLEAGEGKTQILLYTSRKKCKCTATFI